MESIFETDGKHDNKYSSDAILYRDILRYAIQSAIADPAASAQEFKDRELARWLISHNKEFVGYYVDSNANITVSNRIENRLPRIKEKIAHLINFGLLKQVGTVRSATVNIEVPVYSLTVSGALLAWLIESESLVKEKKALALNQVYKIIEEFLKSKDNSRASFLLKFFAGCHLTGCSLDSYVLPVLYGRHFSEFSVVEEFLDMKNIIYWVLSKPKIFEEALNLLDDKDRKAMLHQFKFQIEEYYNSDYVPIAQLYYGKPSKRWEQLRYDTASQYSTIAVPGYCSSCECDVPFLYNTTKYLRLMSSMVRPDSSYLLYGSCLDCGRDSVAGPIISLPLPLEMPQYYGFSPAMLHVDLNIENDKVTIISIGNARKLC